LVGTSQFISRGDFPHVDSRPLLESLNRLSWPVISPPIPKSLKDLALRPTSERFR
jgi:hypothetical protein